MELLDRFGRAREDLIATVSRYPQDNVGDAVYGEWAIKCVLAHIAGWDTYFTTIARLLRTGKDVPFRGDRIQEWNEAFVRERAGRTWNQVRDEFVKAGETFLEEYGSLQEELWSRRFWEGRNPTPAWVVQHSAEHYAEHMDGILGRLRAWT
jgi:uncharacterized damage-inducible protein DinB